MSIKSIARNYYAQQYASDRRPLPQQVGISTKCWDELDIAITGCEGQFRDCKTGFHGGESGAYANELEQLRELVSKLRAIKAVTGMRFDCYPENGGSALLKLTFAGGKEVKIFSQFYDSFTPGLCNGSVGGYVNQNIAKTEQIVNTLLKVL
jgi:hypothetical protein